MRLVYSTHPSLEQARDTADHLLGAKLAACCNIIPGIESHYMWEGKRQRSTELVMLSKTTEAQAPALMAAIRQLHPYECPAILELPVERVDPGFLDWVETTATPR